MSDFRVKIVRSPRRMRQRFHVRLEWANGRVLMSSETYRDLDYVRSVGVRLAGALDATLIDQT